MDLRRFSNLIKQRSESLASVVCACRALLKHSKEASVFREYIKTRLTEKEIDTYDIGFFPSNAQIHLLFDYLQEKKLYDLDLVYNHNVYTRGGYIRKSIFHYNNIIFPLSDEYGNIITLAGRTVLGKEEQKEHGVPKYKNAPFKRQFHLFGINNAKKAIEKENSVFIVEGQIDCIKCQSHGFLNTVALTGSELTIQQANILKRRTDNLYLLLDNDEAGRKASQKIINNYSEYFKIKTLSLPKSYEDVDHYLSNDQSANLLSLASN